MNKTIEMLTVQETAERTGLSAHAIRMWIKSEQLKPVYAGRKILLNWKQVERFLGGEEHDNV
jgi:excisionase family DNA binding protein